MTMAVVRIKRRCNEEPLDVLLLSCKRRKTDLENSHKTSVFKIAATVDEQDDKSLEFTHRFKKDAEQKIKKENEKFKKVTDKLRQENKAISDKSRLKVVNCYRALNSTELASSDFVEKGDPDPGGLTVLDVESCDDDKGEGAGTLPKVAEGGYVYDIYYTADGDDLNDVQMDHELSVFPMDSDLVSQLYGDIDNSDCDAPDDEDDSNEENNWRNDYPDEEDFSSDDGREFSSMKLCSKFKTFQIGDDDDDFDQDDDDDDGDSPHELSSDDDVYSGGFSPTDVHNFGESYAKYKAKVKKHEYDSSCSVNSEESS